MDYTDGSKQEFPLVLGEGVWWGALFAAYPEPYSTDARLRSALAGSLRLDPPAPVPDGRYLAVIVPKAIAIRSIALQDSQTKKGGGILIAGITVEPVDGETIAGTTAVPTGHSSPEFDKFIDEKPLRPRGVDEEETGRSLDVLRRALYTTGQTFHGHVADETPVGYTGPKVEFQGSIFAEILANAFRANLQDMAAKIGDNGMYHTVDHSQVLCRRGSYNGFGTFHRNEGKYFNQTYSRDMGRSLQELTKLGYIDDAERCADYCLRMMRLWGEKPPGPAGDKPLPNHWGRLVNHPSQAGCFENDGHGLTTLSLYALWQRLPNRDEWLRTRWVDVKAAGDWILWQFDHPEISGATDVLHTTGESAGSGPGGPTVYADAVCRDALIGLAQMADSIGEGSSAERWRERAEEMRRAIGLHYFVTDPHYGRIWSLDHAGWSHRSTVLGPLIFLADKQGFAPEDDDPDWRSANLAAYRRLTDTYHPFGFYGQAMGYGQGFVTQSALLLDRMGDATQMLDWAAREIYDPRGIGAYIVLEGCQIDPSGRVSGIGWATWGTECRRRRSSKRCASSSASTTPSRIACGFFPGCLTTGVNFPWRGIRSCSLVREKPRRDFYITGSADRRRAKSEWKSPPTRIWVPASCAWGRSGLDPLIPIFESMEKITRRPWNSAAIPGGFGSRSQSAPSSACWNWQRQRRPNGESAVKLSAGERRRRETTGKTSAANVAKPAPPRATVRLFRAPSGTGWSSHPNRFPCHTVPGRHRHR